mgnify:CR=1 FL=1
MKSRIAIPILALAMATLAHVGAQPYHKTSSKVGYKCLFNHELLIICGQKTNSPQYIASFIEKLDGLSACRRLPLSEHLYAYECVVRGGRQVLVAFAFAIPEDRGLDCLDLVGRHAFDAVLAGEPLARPIHAAVAIKVDGQLALHDVPFPLLG